MLPKGIEHMKSYFVMTLLAALSHMSAGYQIICPGNNISSDLSHVKPVGMEYLSVYPPVIIYTYTGRPFIISCCSTGFSGITWERDGVALGPSNLDTHEFENTREVMLLYGIAFTSPPLPSGFHETVYTCKAYAANRTHSISHHILVRGFDAPPEARPPTLSIMPHQKACYRKGDTVRIYCKLSFSYPLSDSLDMWYILLTYRNGTSIAISSIDGLYSRMKRSDSVSLYVMIRNVTESWLDEEYTCQYNLDRNISKSFLINKC
ncbi:uncharacterized protein [Watersipora subatra]|uniref:uncharacterized protein n=1 Tax=Watersipora subatra TaxID=2589382 RepID=UPI00355BBCA6